MRHTRQREAILNALQNAEQHPTAEWVFERVRRELPRIGLGTVYRHLHQLEKEGAIGALHVGTGAKRYDSSPGPHHHVVCTACGQIQDVPNLVSEEAQAEVARWTGYAVTGMRLEWAGICPACRAQIKE